MSVAPGDIITPADLDALAALANGKGSLAGTPYDFTPGNNFKTELARLRKNLFAQIYPTHAGSDPMHNGFLAAAMVSGPWPQTGNDPNGAGGGAGRWSMTLTPPYTGIAGGAVNPLFIKNAGQNLMMGGPLAYIFPGGGATPVKVTVQYKDGSTVTTQDFHEATATPCDGIYSGNLLTLAIPVNLAVTSTTAIIAAVTAGDNTGIFMVMLAPARGAPLTAHCAKDSEWGGLDATGLGTETLNPYGLAPRLPAAAPEDFITLSMAVPGAVTGTATFTRQPHNNGPTDAHFDGAGQETITCQYYKIALGLSDPQQMEKLDGSLTNIDPAFFTGTWCRSGTRPLISQDELPFLTARLTDGAGTTFWWETVYLGQRGYRQWFIAVDSGQYYLYLLIDIRSNSFASDPWQLQAFPGDLLQDTVINNPPSPPRTETEIDSPCGLVRKFFVGATQLQVKRETHFGFPYGLYNGAALVNPFTGGVTMTSIFRPAGGISKADYLAGSQNLYSQLQAGGFISRTNGIPPNWVEYPAPWTWHDTPVSAQRSGPVPYWAVGLQQGGLWAPGQSLKLVLSVKVNQPNTIDFKIIPQTVGFFANNPNAGLDFHRRNGAQPPGSQVWEVQVNRSARHQELVMRQADGTIKLSRGNVMGLQLYYPQCRYDAQDNVSGAGNTLLFGLVTPAYQMDAICGANSLGATADAELTFGTRMYGEAASIPGGNDLTRLVINPALYRVDKKAGVIAFKGAGQLSNPFDQFSDGTNAGDDYSLFLAVYTAHPDPGTPGDLPQIVTQLGKQIDSPMGFVPFTDGAAIVNANEARADRMHPKWVSMSPLSNPPIEGGFQDSQMLLRQNRPELLSAPDDYSVAAAVKEFDVPWPNDGNDYTVEGNLYTITAKQDMVIKFNGTWRRVMWMNYAGWKALGFGTANTPFKGFYSGADVAAPPAISGLKLTQSFLGPSWNGIRRQYQFFAADQQPVNGPVGAPLTPSLAGSDVRLTGTKGEPADGDMIFALVDDFYTARHFLPKGVNHIPVREVNGNNFNFDGEMQMRLIALTVTAAWQWFDVDIWAYSVQPFPAQFPGTLEDDVPSASGIASSLGHNYPTFDATVQGPPFAFHYNDTVAALGAIS